MSAGLINEKHDDDDDDDDDDDNDNDSDDDASPVMTDALWNRTNIIASSQR